MNRILLLIEHKKNRELLREWLSLRYEVVEIVPPFKLTDEFDLVIIDGVALDVMWHELYDRKNSEEPVFVPVLFITNHQAIKMVTRHLWRSVDEIIWTPVEKIELMARVEVLLRARRVSVALQKSNTLKLNFLAMVSHELRTPLTSIKGFTSTLLSEDMHFDAEHQRDFLEVIAEESEKMQDLVDQLIDLSRLESGTFAIKSVPVDLHEIIDYSHTHFDILKQRHQLHVEVPPDLPLLMADTHRVAQVLANLIGNAAKYSPEQAIIKLRAFLTADCVQIDVIDAGSGIPPEQRDDIFEAFHQVKKSTDDKGAGLGLAICKGIVEAHGGRIWVADGDAAGTTISLILPTVE
jgi:signal transduction histidine kinase